MSKVKVSCICVSEGLDPGAISDDGFSLYRYSFGQWRDVSMPHSIYTIADSVDKVYRGKLTIEVQDEQG